MTDDQFELATAYLDGEATTAERAIVESDSELLAEVERMRDVRNALSDVEPPSDEARESAIAAALSAFAELPSRREEVITPPWADVTAPANIVPFERRRRIRRLQALSAAAAAIVIVAGGVAITQRGDDPDSSSAERDGAPTTAALPADPAVAPTEMTVAPTTTGEPMMAVVPTTVGEAADDASDAELSTDDTDVAEVAAASEASATGGAAPTVPQAPAPDGAVAPLVMVRDEDDLTDFAATMQDAPMTANDAEAECADQTLKADAEYEDDDGTIHPIVVVIFDQGDDDTLGALTLDGCEFVLRVD